MTQRQLLSSLSNLSPLSSHTHGGKEVSSRNHHGKITVGHRGGGHKALRRSLNVHSQWRSAIIHRIEYDPHRSAHIILVLKDNKHWDYLLAPQSAQLGQSIYKNSLSTPGSYLPLHRVPLGSLVHNLHYKFVRSAGTSAQLLSRHQFSLLKIPSGQLWKVHNDWFTSLGSVSNPHHDQIISGKAGRSRWLGVRPRVRGEAINAVDHPHGGSTRGGKPRQSRWGKIIRSPKVKL